ncbi:MAG TPA: hypothetical protein PK909_06335 [Sphaerochaeta sp.]|jgi:hypothetical protein|nr:hypothetical protein [Spirochaetales bacterium]HQB55082.1 hypothetical protein [Sphaerochaeta sp.]
MKRRISILLLLITVLSVGLSAEPFYDKGNQTFSFTLGTTVPTFVHFFSDNETRAGLGVDNTGMKVGGYGAISYQAFTSPYSAIGGEVGYDFNYVVDGNLYTAVPFFFKYSYFPVQGTIDLPISFGLGFAYNSGGANTSIMTLYSNIELGLTYYPGEHWGFGVRTGLWLIPELNYRKELFADNALAGFVPITLSVSYRQ